MRTLLRLGSAYTFDMTDGHERKPTPPLKRHRALQPLSREHMSGLIQARNLAKAADCDCDARRAAIGSFVEVWRSEIQEHFDDEERLLLPFTRDPGLRERLLIEHQKLRKVAERCAKDPEGVAADPALMVRLGSLLHDHIRWEEREYFEAIQRDYPDALASLMHEADSMERRRPGARARRTLG